MDPRSAHGKRDVLQIIDVREHGEWKAGHIDGAQHIPMGDIPARLDEIDDDNLDGGMKVWAKAGLPIAGPGGRAGKVV